MRVMRTEEALTLKTFNAIAIEKKHSKTLSSFIFKSQRKIKKIIR
jgi:hypothetical protein